MTPSPDSVGSSSCSAITPPHSRWYCSALRSMPALATGLPSSVKPSAPASRSSAISVSASPCRPARDRRRGSRRARAPRAGRVSRSERRTGRESTAGSVFGIAITAPKPPAAAARVPGVEVLLVLLARACAGARAGRRRPGTGGGPRRRWSRRPRAPRSLLARARRSRRRARARRAARRGPVRGSSTWAPRISRSAGGCGHAVQRWRAHAGCGSGRRASRRRRLASPAAPGEQLVEHRHAHHDAGLRPGRRSPPAASRSPRRRARPRG